MIAALFLFGFIAIAQAQYGAPPQYNPPPFYRPPPLLDNYVCSIEAGYPLFGGEGHRSHRRPAKNFCVDSLKADSCQRCCEMAAQIGGTTIKQTDIVGFHIVLRREPLCICCAPSSTYPSTYTQQPTVFNPASAPSGSY